VKGYLSLVNSILQRYGVAKVKLYFKSTEILEFNPYPVNVENMVSS